MICAYVAVTVEHSLDAKSKESDDCKGHLSFYVDHCSVKLLLWLPVVIVMAAQPFSRPYDQSARHENGIGAGPVRFFEDSSLWKSQKCEKLFR